MTFSHGSSHSRRRVAAAVAGLAAAALILTGCSSGGGTAPATPETPEGPIAMTVARGQVNIENSIIAQEQGFFKDAGLEVTLEVSQGASATNSAVISGEFDVALTDATSASRAIAEGMPITVVSGQKYASPDHPVESGVLLPPGSPITGWKDLQGKKVGIPDLGGLPQLTVMQAMTENGLDPKSVEFVALPLPALAETAAKGEVAAIFVFSIFYAGPLGKGFTPLGTGVAEFLPNAPQSVWIASTEYVQKNGAAVEKFRKALDQANTFIKTNPDAVRKVYEENTQLPPAYIANMTIVPLSIELPRDGWELLLKVMKETGELSKALTYDEVVWEGAR